MWMMKNIISFFDTTFFPRICYICKKDGAVLCSSCLQSFEKSYDTPHPFISSVYSYKDKRIKKIIHAIKYFHRKDLIPPVAQACKEKIEVSLFHYKEPIIIVPIPMPRVRKYMRGYNHAEELARHISNATSFPLINTILLRTSWTKQQVFKKTRSERLKNQRNAFSVNTQHIPEGSTILLIDDVTTTGATLREARNVLLQGGAKNVLAYTIAH